jgi:hypothetical protein
MKYIFILYVLVECPCVATACEISFYPHRCVGYANKDISMNNITKPREESTYFRFSNYRAFIMIFEK